MTGAEGKARGRKPLPVLWAGGIIKQWPVECADIETDDGGTALKLEPVEERTVTKRERKDIRWVIVAFALVFLVASVGLFGSFGLLAGTH
jgi:nitrate reductase NapE component